MANSYTGVGAAAVGTDKTVMNLISSATRRPALTELIVSCSASPADLSTLFHLERFTAVGTEGSGFTPLPVDPASPAAASDFGVAHSAEPTYTASAILMKFALHQRSIFRWVAAPGRELVAPATANNGIGLQSQSSGGTASHDATMFFVE
jgi:hypothetical protein